jgi:hypothetical protein
MKLFSKWMLLALAGGWPGVISAQLQLLPDREMQRVFAGERRSVVVVWRNVSNHTVDTEILLRLYQTTSATAVSLAEWPWKRIEVLPGQTVFESAQVDFPEVRAETSFLIQWLEGTNRVVGQTRVQVYPTNLLQQLKPLFGEALPGILDPNNELKPLLQRNRVDFLDLTETPLEDFQGRFAVIGPFSSKAQMREGLTQSIRKIAERGAVVIWIQPPPEPKDKLKPSFYVVPDGKGTVVVVQSGLVADLPGNPQSQLNLIYLCKLALNPQPPALPDYSS